jgi:thioredoxin-related protein
MKQITVALSITAILIGGCSGTTKEAKEIATPPAQHETAAPETAQAEPTGAAAPNDAVHATSAAQPSAELSKFYTIFKDGAQIAPEGGKPVLLVFGQPADPYTRKLQDDVVTHADLAQAIRETVTPIYINAAETKLHKFLHNGDMMDVDTKTLVSIYHLDATPTLIFMDEHAQSIFTVPGYMPPKQFAVTLQFLKEGAWKGKDRKNGEVYEALKSFYEAHGINVSKKAKP